MAREIQSVLLLGHYFETNNISMTSRGVSSEGWTAMPPVMGKWTVDWCLHDIYLSSQEATAPQCNRV
jgi:hypothetical protein